MEKLIFHLSYLLNLTPWEVSEMPPEIVETLASFSRGGTALDMGCGTGEYSHYLAKQGWQVIGIDYAINAINQARKSAQAHQLNIDFRVGDINKLSEMHILSIKLVLDIKCSHGLSAEERINYTDALWEIMEADSLLLLEALHPRSEFGFAFGLTESDVMATYAQRFKLIKSTQNDRSGWYWLQKS